MIFLGLLPWLIQIGSASATTPFTIDRIELYFENHRAETTVVRNSPNLKAFALIRVTGSGLLQGQWQVDGRPIGFVSQQAFSGQTITLQTPANPPLPTFDPGTHRLQFVPSSPAPVIPLPTALYFVSVSEVSKKRVALLEPENKSRQRYQAITFKWEPINNTSVYLIEFYDQPRGTKPIYSAMTREATFILDELCIEKICGIKGVYYWRVKGFDGKSAVVGESELWSFQFK